MGVVDVLARQKQEIKDKLARDIVERDIEGKIAKSMNKSIVKVVTGIRRSGKSTLALLLLKNRMFGYVNFDEEEMLGVKLDSLLSGIKEVYGDVKTLLLDEVQNIKGWELWVNSLERRGYNLIITGSNAQLLSKELATHLTGRYLEFEVFPFSFNEYLRWKKFDLTDIKYLREKQGSVKRVLREYFERGGFPEYLVEGLSKDYLLTLFRAIIYNDVVKRWKIKHAARAEGLARYLLSIYAREFSASRLRKILGFNSTLTVLNYIKYFKEAFLLFEVEMFSFKAKDFMKAPKKVYSIDLGLSDVVGVKTSENTGLKMENLVFLSLKRKGFRENKEVFYFKHSTGEVDFVVKNGLNIKQLIQVTYASARDEINNREIKALLKASELLNCKDLLIITWDYEAEEEIKSKKIRFVPLWKWLLGNL